MRLPKELEKRFWSRVDKHGPKVKKYVLKLYSELKGTRCWEWLGTIDKNGYGYFNIYGRMVYAHRVSYILCVGKLKYCSLHKCDNPKCVNPLHLFDGTLKQNSRDMVSKGRHAPPDNSGERNGNSKLSRDKVAYIRTHYSREKRNMPKLARKFGVSTNTISLVVLEKTYKGEML